MSDKTEDPKTPNDEVKSAVEAVATSAPSAEAVDAVTAKLNELGITDAEVVDKIKALGAESVADLSSLREADLTSVGVPVLKARKFVEASSAPAPVAVAAAPVGNVNFDAILPSVPDDGSWLSALRSGGVLKIDQSTVISAIRAALADRFGLYGVQKKLLAAIDAHIDVTEEQVTEEYWSLRKALTRKSHGDLFTAIEGLDSSYVTDGRKNELLRRINADLWPAIFTFHESLEGWQNSWMQGQAANPNMMMGMLAQLASGGNGGMGMPPGMMQPPDCGVIRDAAEAVNDKLNRSFRGTGVQITAALAYEANEVKKMLSNPSLPRLCGVDTHDLLLKKLNLAVPATYPRMEQNLTKFVLAIIGSTDIAGGNEEQQYFGTLFMLGAQIPWNELARTHGIDSAEDVVKGGRGRSRRPRGIGADEE